MTTRADFLMHIESCQMKEAPLLDLDPVLLLASAKKTADGQTAIRLLQQAIQVASASGGYHSHTSALGCIALSDVYLTSNKPKDAIASAQDAIRRLRPLPKSLDLSDALYRLGESFRRDGKCAEATLAFVEALTICRAIDPKAKVVSLCEKGLGMIDRKLDDDDGALLHYTQALGLADESEADVIASLMVEQADVIYKRNPSDAILKYTEAIATFKQSDTIPVADAMLGKARALMDIGQGDSVPQLLKDSETIYKNSAVSPDDTRFYVLTFLKARSMAHDGDYQQAIQLLEHLKSNMNDNDRVTFIDINISLAETVVRMKDARKSGFADYLSIGQRATQDAMTLLKRGDPRSDHVATLVFLLAEAN